MKHTLVYHYILPLLFLLSFNNISAQNNNGYRDIMKFDSDELLKRGIECESGESMDSAVIYYSVLSNRAYGTKDKELIKKCCEAYVRKSMLYFSYFFDYSKAYEDILAAIDLENEFKLDYHIVYNTAAVLYHVIAVTCRDWNMERTAIEYCRKDYEGAQKNGDRREMDIVVTNMILMSCNLDDLSVLENVWKTYSVNSDSAYSYRFNQLFYEYLKHRNKKNYGMSVSEADKMLKLSSDSADERRMVIAYNSIVETLEKKGDYEKALHYVNMEEKLVHKLKLKEHEIEILDTKVNLYKKLGNEDSADYCSHQYLLQKDSLLNLKQMKNICHTLYDGKNIKMEKEIKEMSIKNKIYNDVILIVLFFLVILVIMVVVLYIKIKQLKKSNITIYENNIENLKNEEKERQKLKSEILKLGKTSENNYEPDDEDGEPEEDMKYKTNSISEDEKKRLLDKILTIMEDVDEICSESFSAARLAELTGAKYNYVSLVINENYGCNFNNFVNKFRIKEACRRLADEENYGIYTIDSISNSLGFKSRTTLTTSFKKIVGLTPSQYRNIAREKKTR